ncbi:zinc finger protein 658B-like isoform X2 [Lampris incognitus]|uniref:zinc finger protein 658B-like isoform X2 n=1 Tax=Lampris incognitus TaxID=2546036 RepID=UPI0024B53FF9|nr:zinc finger protein 658B-like isoform X2 [Lampris incognitus]
MDLVIFDAAFPGTALPLSSLRLLVPPLQLMTASMWQVIKQQDVMNYWKVAEFVSLVMDMVPELLMYKHRTQLDLGLRARYILELCRSEPLVDPEFFTSLLDKVKPLTPLDVSYTEVDGVEANFLELVQMLLKGPEEREHFFLEVFPSEYGPQYDSDLQTLFSEFLCRLAQLLPIPDLDQIVSWLGISDEVLEDCVHSVSESMHLKTLIQHHKHLGHLEQHVPPSSMGDSILSSLSATHPSRMAGTTEQPSCDSQSDPLHGLGDDPQAVSFVDDVAVEVVAVTDYAEVELGMSTEVQVVTEGGDFEEVVVEVMPEESVEILPEETKGEEVGRATEEKTQERPNSVQLNLVVPEKTNHGPVSIQHKSLSGPLDCPDCGKRFKFASSLIAHRVIHTGERPHQCNECGRCFSFRQSMDRHKHTHKAGRKYDCTICGEDFPSLSDCTEHKQRHMVDGAFACPQCNKTFSWEVALIRHLNTHTDDANSGEPTGSLQAQQEEVASEQNVEEQVVALAETNRQATAVEKEDHDGSTKEAEAQKSHHPSSVTEVLVPKLLDEVISLVKVRASGRKRKPTMKVQVINLQKRIGRVSSPKRKREVAVEKPVAFNSAEHSYGTLLSSAKDSDKDFVLEGSSAGFSCPKCTFSHTDQVELQRHVDQEHADDAEEVTSAPPLANHDGRFSCPDCEKSFKFQSLLKAHRRIHTGEQPYLCSQCGRRFSFKQSLERHKHTHKDGRKYECLICGKFFKSLAAQREHKSIHMENGEYLCSKCGRAFAWKSALVRHLKTHGDEADKAVRPHRCPHCDLGFSSITYLNRHLQTHGEERLHTCNCGKSFPYKAALTAHERTHRKERPHQCAQCGKGFLYKGGLLSHMKIHSSDMPFMCSFCGKSFKRERNMKKHERCHTRENVFSCTQCDKSFVYKATLIRHELTHSGERPFLCSDCGKGFFSHAELLKHERFHTGHKPFQCPHCGKRFTQSCYLTIHLRYHTGVRPYSCTECDKSFLSANRLKRHQRTHTGEKPYLCGECGKGFKQSYHLKMHQRTHAITFT